MEQPPDLAVMTFLASVTIGDSQGDTMLKNVSRAAAVAFSRRRRATVVGASASPASRPGKATTAQNRYQVAANVTYLTATGFEAKLDVYRRRDVTTPQPTMVFYHGGGWVGGTKESSFMSVMPWLEMGWNVVNVEYRMARVAEAPAAVEDALCALRFVVAGRTTTST
jgi:acetyl esterase/lipase